MMTQKNRRIRHHNHDRNRNENLEERLGMKFEDFQVQLEINTNKPLPRQPRGLNLCQEDN